jgi:predicted nucleic acid-binding Zn ribbon protein
VPQALDEYDRDDDRDGDDDDDSLDEDPLESDQDPDDDLDPEESVPCPFCKKLIHEDADVCPRCGNFVGAADAPRRVPMVIWIGFALAILCVLVWVLR